MSIPRPTLKSLIVLDGYSLSTEHSPFFTVDERAMVSSVTKPRTHVNKIINGSRFFTCVTSNLSGYFIATHLSNDIIVRPYTEQLTNDPNI